MIIENTEKDPNREFSVYWYDNHQVQYEEKRFVTIRQAMEAFDRLTGGPASILGVVQRCIITDGGDVIEREWKNGKITFPHAQTPPSK